ncbi:exosortase-associated protein EpsI, B-type [Paucibacter sp. M5-1]|uniref:exosortase-associated protein EpsI, B-type n=1 Tax=Paucibacter sp. M5-1 TaxID=3015998 RepID=UPI0022B8DABF|nr:exosortase-associated protein EpsI, B-type [Paucibacter sp. M5-1]MCZ7879474.1 EpsI family protein [Paucibacter sp. M5-1]
MTAARWKSVLVAVLAVLAALAANALRPTQHLADMRPKLELAQLFPGSFAGWSEDTRGPVQLVSPDQQAVLNKIYNQTLSRTYVNSAGDRVMLSVAYGGDQSDGTRAHRPDVCYPAQGFQVRGDRTSTVSVGTHQVPSRLLVAQQGSRIEPITYWMVVGERIALSGTEQKMAQLTYSARGIIPDGMLVRVSTIDADTERAYGIHRKFIEEMAMAVQGENRARAFGNPSGAGR